MTSTIMDTKPNKTEETEVKKGHGVTMSINNHDHSNNNKVENEEEEGRDVEGQNDDGSTTIWELFVTLYLPFMIDMFKYIMLGSVSLVQLSLGVVGQYIERTGSVKSINKNIGGTTTGGIGTTLDPHEWPQQFLTALGVLTIFALVIHPDGFTWVVLGKFRDFVYTVFCAIADCWEVLGIFPTIAALMTLSALFFLMFLVVRTLTSKTPKRASQQSQDKRKRKKKKDQKSRGGRRGDNHRNKNRSVPFRIQPRTEQQQEKLEERRAEPEKDADSVSTSLSSGSVLTPLPELSTSIEDPARGASSRSRSESATDSSDAPGSTADDIAVATTKKRNRVSSSSTQDTTPSLDDISCSSTSVRSYPSVSVSSSRSKDKSRSPKPVRTPSRKGGKSSGTRSSKTQSSGGSSKKGMQTEPSTPSSRWDALKPHQKSQEQHEKHYKPGLVQRSSTRRGVNNYNQRHEFKSSTYTPPRSVIASTNHQQQNKGGNESRPTTTTHNVSLPPPGFQDQSPSANDEPLRTFDSNNSSRDDIALAWLRNDASTDQSLVATPVFTEQFHTPSSGTPTARASDWNDEMQLFPSPSRSTVSKGFTHSSPTILDSPSRVGDSTKYYSSSLKENPFDDSERQVEEELQELEQLGGQMAGSILDF
eukprot:CAMPEP_0113455184 /NCGR_PEP_ID=MMETSP0014_2-20120614/8245_1 /TAXON_ID=2857 /ORGANISM="Nitzschia sp." /LENGTH=645 /DNA_ID=CAMNT_0000346607 /DNA_START=313 /DNA_END=2250 /DNA_ORIENTATION=- /assembly_acc=CAM_ASM_000159